MLLFVPAKEAILLLASVHRVLYILSNLLGTPMWFSMKRM